MGDREPLAWEAGSNYDVSLMLFKRRKLFSKCFVFFFLLLELETNKAKSFPERV